MHFFHRVFLQTVIAVQTSLDCKGYLVSHFCVCVDLVLSRSMWSCIVCRVYHILLCFCLIYDTIIIQDIYKGN